MTAMKFDMLIVDEERLFVNRLKNFFRLEGLKAHPLYDATSALKYVTEINQPIPLFLDIALAPGDDNKLFSRLETDKYLKTGLILADLILEKTSIYKENPSQLILYTAHWTGDLWDDILEFQDRHGTQVWQKTHDANFEELLEKL